MPEVMKNIKSIKTFSASKLMLLLNPLKSSSGVPYTILQHCSEIDFC